MAVKKRSKLVMLMREEDEAGTYHPTEDDVILWFRIINREVFNASLSSFDEIEIRRRRKIWGECLCTKYDNGDILSKLFLNNKFHNKKQFVNVLAHEMVHLWEFLTYGKMGHGKEFNSWKPKLDAFEVELSTIY